jgi:hypothetical protein
MLSMHYKIKRYTEILPDFPLYFTLCKIRTDLFHYIYPGNHNDLFQMIAFCILKYKMHDAIIKGMYKEMHNYVRVVLGISSNERNIKKKKYKSIPKYKLICDICKKSKQEYMLKTVIPNKQVCRSCAKKIKSENRRLKNMHPVDLIANAIRNEVDIYIPAKTDPGICCVTGIECQTIPKKEIISSNFTNYDLLKSPGSDRIGVAAAISLKYRPERSSWFVSEKEFVTFNKKRFRDMFLNGVKNSKKWAIYITTSYKKHGALVTKLNGRGIAKGKMKKYGTWRFEQLNVDASNGKINRSWYDKIFEALKAGIGRSIIESLNCPSYLIKKIGLKEWMKFEKWARDKYQSPLYKLCCYLLPSQEDLKNEKIS